MKWSRQRLFIIQTAQAASYHLLESITSILSRIIADMLSLSKAARPPGGKALHIQVANNNQRTDDAQRQPSNGTTQRTQGIQVQFLLLFILNTRITDRS